MTMEDIYKVYNVIFMSMFQFGIWNEEQKSIFISLMGDIGKAYCKENDLPWPLPHEQTKNRNPADMKLGPESIKAFADMKLWLSGYGGLTFVL